MSRKQEIYEILYDQLANQREIVTESDKLLLKRLAFNVEAVEKCEQILDEQGLVVEGLHGLKEHPAVSVKNKEQSKMRENIYLLGFDFTSSLKQELNNQDDWSWL